MFSQTVEYALRAMVYLASQPEEASNSEKIAEATQVPAGYLSKVMRDLVVGGLLSSQRGPNGGFTLARPADKISILDVINSVDPIRRISECPLGNPLHVKLCPLHQRLDNALAAIETEFAKTSLDEIIVEANTKGKCGVLMMPSKQQVTVRRRAASG
jgi:Rrf2 family protein